MLMDVLIFVGAMVALSVNKLACVGYRSLGIHTVMVIRSKGFNVGQCWIGG